MAGVDGNRHLFEVTETGDLIRQVTTGDRQLGSVSTSADGLVMAYTVTDAVTPTELFVNRGDGSLQQRVTSFNDGWLAGVSRQPAERLTWTVADGTDVEGWVIKPVGYEAGRPYPMVLKIHGGPHGAYGNSYVRTFHVLSNAGFFVLAAASFEQVSHEADRLTSPRSRRAAAARAVRSAGAASPVPQYISSGVWPRNAECGSTRLC